MANIVILGGGVGGIVAATRLRKKLPDEHDVIIIDRDNVHTFSPAFPWVLTGERDGDEISRGLGILAKKGITVINREVIGIDPQKMTVTTGDMEIPCDYMIVSLGASLAPDALQGFKDSTHNVYTLDGVKGLKHCLEDFRGGDTIILVSSLPYKCPAAPYEYALLLDALFSKKKIRDKVNLKIFTPEVLPMPVAGPVVGNMVKSMLEKKGINFNPQMKASSIDTKQSKIIFENGDSVHFDLIAGIPPHKAPEVVARSPLASEAGWIKVDKSYLSTHFKNVFAIGDCTSIALPNGKPLPKAGVFAHFEADIVADNIVSDIKGEKGKKAFNGRGYCFLEAGFGKAGFASGRFFAEPNPVVNMRMPARVWHWGKILFEKWWLKHWF